ncbi:MAG TPA: hypothetical protein ENK21_08845 [Trueperaceae bacterium]|nr:hypothetical protein [Trueperaceae bacterium]
MPFQPLIVVILLIFLVLLSLALFIWFLLAMGQDKKLVDEQKQSQKHARQKPSGRRPKIDKLRAQSQQTERPKIGYLSKKELAGADKPKATETRKKPTIPPYQELRPISKNRASKSAANAKQRINDIKTSEVQQIQNFPPKTNASAKPKLIDAKSKEITTKPKDKAKTVEVAKEAPKPQEETKANTKTKNNEYRGLNATKKDRQKEKPDPFDSFVEANKKLG